MTERRRLIFTSHSLPASKKNRYPSQRAPKETKKWYKPQSQPPPQSLNPTNKHAPPLQSTRKKKRAFKLAPSSSPCWETGICTSKRVHQYLGKIACNRHPPDYGVDGAADLAEYIVWHPDRCPLELRRWIVKIGNAFFVWLPDSEQRGWFGEPELVMKCVRTRGGVQDVLKLREEAEGKGTL